MTKEELREKISKDINEGKAEKFFRVSDFAKDNKDSDKSKDIKNLKD